MSERRIVVSIDFGTTYSGIAWSETSRPDSQTVIESWPGKGYSNTSSPKVPTELRKTSDGYQWGFQIPVSAKRNRYFKLKLDGATGDNNDTLPPEQLTELYMGRLYEHFRTVLEAQLSASVLRSTPIDFVVTVPAIWSNSAKQKTQQAAEKAGFRPNNGGKAMYIVSEPEAAAIYTLNNLGYGTLQIGKRFVVCDAGGGTVDLITYEVLSLNKVRVKEVTEGTGGKCGSSMLNQRFRRYLKKAHGEAYWTDDRLVPALAEFETYKKEWRPDGDALILQVDPSLNIRRNRYRVPPDDMESKIFEPILRDVLDLIKEQVRFAGGDVAAVLLVGGFGQSPYLKTRVQQVLGGSVAVLQPQNGWTAVVRGAAMLGMSRVTPSRVGVSIESRMARQHYGIELTSRYDSYEHDSGRAYRDKQFRRVVDVMCWFIEKGESYPCDRTSSIPYDIDIPHSSWGQQAPTEFEIYANSEDSTAPTYRNDRTRQVAVLKLHMNKISRSALDAVGTTWKGLHRYYVLSGSVEAKYDSAMVTYTAKLAGEVHDVVSVEYMD